MYNQHQLDEMKITSMNEGWKEKIANVAGGVKKVAGGAVKAGGVTAKGAGTLARGATNVAKGKHGRVAQIAGIGAAAGAAASVAKKITVGRKKQHKADSASVYGGGSSGNPYAKKSLSGKLGLSTSTNEAVQQEGIIGSAVKGAALAGAGYAAYKGAKALKNPETRAKIGSVAKKVGGVVRSIGSKFLGSKDAGGGSVDHLNPKGISKAGSDYLRKRRANTATVKKVANTANVKGVDPKEYKRKNPGANIGKVSMDR